MSPSNGGVIDKSLFKALGRAVAENALRHDGDATLDRRSWQRMAELGMWKIPVTRELGGFGGTWAECAECLDEVAKECEDLGFLITVLGHIGSLKLLCSHGSAQQIQRWVPRLLKGEIAVTAMTESSGGSDLSKMQLSAVREGSGYRLSGQKKHITNAPVATMGMLAGRIPALGPKKDITLFFMDLDAPGISVGEQEFNLGIRTSPTADLNLVEVAIDEGNIIGAPGRGLTVLYEIISFERALYGIIAAGLIDGMTRSAMQRSQYRQAFGQAIGAYQYIQGRLTEMKMSSIVCRNLAYEALRLLDRNDPEASMVCSTAKYQGAECLMRSAESLMQVHGHLGYSDPRIGKYLRDAAGLKIAGGTNDIQRINIFNQMSRC
ncbi:acyl-CoA/acyl-ACP dehydrogenase [Pseudomonas gingeri]|uniref:acyl-CoA dehydrogenase family protein n=1 Tax=Pseudomonas gingeri TaxID=117681 RepID=UPI0015A050DF|nr:acyl-CoA dehydrogenase family protein [Pseudomonas gingeri]NWA29157.1 acyl-CoA/acyl-ACP dehydrogenase [Pseudomonas gingeri]NWD72269.1 acyl-CoA/acyl-ACP dehydrogenase [Pseudomonas gingeri]